MSNRLKDNLFLFGDFCRSSPFFLKEKEKEQLEKNIISNITSFITFSYRTDRTQQTEPMADPLHNLRTITVRHIRHLPVRVDLLKSANRALNLYQAYCIKFNIDFSSLTPRGETRITNPVPSYCWTSRR